MKNFSSCILVIFWAIFTGDASCRKLDHHTKHSNGTGRIVGGYEIDIKDVPYQAKLTIIKEDGAYGCAGTILSQNYVLTAAHCITDAKTVYIRVGSKYSDKEGTVYTSTKFWIHPDYNRKTIDYDAAIISPEKPIEYNGNVKAVTLAGRGQHIPAGTEALIIGWGRTTEGGEVSQTLKAIRVPVVSTKDCLKKYTYISDAMICVGLPEGGKSVCQGDSGGPAHSKYGQIGIASFSIGCARPDYPGVFARVSDPPIRDWIKRISGI